MQLDFLSRMTRVEQFWQKVAAVALIVFIVAGLLFTLNHTNPLNLGYIAANFTYLLKPAGLTLFVTAASYAAGMGLGFFLGWLRTLKIRPVRAVATGWVESIRGTPFLVQIYLLFSLFSYYNPGDLPPTSRYLLTGFVAMMINTGAYQAEIFRAGLQSVPFGQVEAAKAVGFRYWGRMRRVILPQAFRTIVPPLTNEFILMLKASSLLALLGVQELTYVAKTQSFESGNFVEVYVMVTSLYILMTIPIAKGVAWLERKYRIPGLGLQQDIKARPRRGSDSVVARILGSNLRELRATHQRSATMTD